MFTQCLFLLRSECVCVFIKDIFHIISLQNQEKSEFLLPYLVELIVVLIQCVLSIIKFILLDPYDEDSVEKDISYDVFYDRPKHLTKEEKRYILATFIITSIGWYKNYCFSISHYYLACVFLLFFLYSYIQLLVCDIGAISAYAVL